MVVAGGADMGPVDNVVTRPRLCLWRPPVICWELLVRVLKACSGAGWSGGICDLLWTSNGVVWNANESSLIRIMSGDMVEGYGGPKLYGDADCELPYSFGQNVSVVKDAKPGLTTWVSRASLSCPNSVASASATLQVYTGEVLQDDAGELSFGMHDSADIVIDGVPELKLSPSISPLCLSSPDPA